jgi:hypothetical protein
LDLEEQGTNKRDWIGKRKHTSRSDVCSKVSLSTVIKYGKMFSGCDWTGSNRKCSLELERSNGKTGERSDLFLLAE